MPRVKVTKEGEPIDITIRRFKRAMEKAGIPKELRKREFHQKKSLVKRRERAAAKKRLSKRLTREAQMWVTGPSHGSNNARNATQNRRGGRFSRTSANSQQAIKK